MSRERLLLYATTEYTALGEKVAKALGVSLQSVERSRFPDGELYQRVLVPAPASWKSDWSRCATVILSGTHNDSTTLELFDLACELANHSQSLTFLIPYFGYSTMERAVAEGEVVTAKTRATLMSSIPQAPLGNQFVFFDLHSAGIPHYLQAGLGHQHLYGKSLIRQICLDWFPQGDFVLASTDSGRAQWVESLAKDMGVGASYILKQRLSGQETKVKAVQASVEGQNVVIYDDMIRTGGSLIKAAQAYLEFGAKQVRAVATHGVLPAGATERLQECGYLCKVAVSDSHPQAHKLAESFPQFLEVHSCADIFANFLSP